MTPNMATVSITTQGYRIFVSLIHRLECDKTCFSLNISRLGVNGIYEVLWETPCILE